MKFLYFSVLIGDEVILPAYQDRYAVRVIGDSSGVAEMIFCDVNKSSRDHSHILVPSTDVLGLLTCYPVLCIYVVES